MSSNVSTFGLFAYLIASKTMPVGFPIKAFADDTDSVQVHEVQTGNALMDLNGSVLRYASGVPLTVSIGVVPDSTEDTILAVIYNSNRAAKTSKLAQDSITLILNFPNGGVRTFVKGRIISGPASSTATSDGRMNGNVYTFAFCDQYAVTLASALNAAAPLIRSTVSGALGL